MKIKLHINNIKIFPNIIVFQFLLLFCVQSVFAANWYSDDSSPLVNTYNLNNSPFVTINDNSEDGSAIKAYVTLASAYTLAAVDNIIYANNCVYVNHGTIVSNKVNIQIIGAGAATTIFKFGSVSVAIRLRNLKANKSVFKGI